MYDWTRKAVQDLVDGKVFVITCTEEEVDEVVNYIEDKGIPTYSYSESGR